MFSPLQTDVRQQHDLQIPSAGKSHVQVAGIATKNALLLLTSHRYLQHVRIANQIQEFQDFHPLVMFTDTEQGSLVENPFTGNDRFVVYEDGGRPLGIQLALGWRPTCSVVRRIAGQLLEVLAYLRAKKVVHRKLEMGSVVSDTATNDIKLISLGEAKYIEPLDYESQVLAFEREWLGHSVAREIGSKRTAHGRASSPPAPHPNLSSHTSDADQSMLYVHPALRCEASRMARQRLHLAHANKHAACCLTSRSDRSPRRHSLHRSLLSRTIGPSFPRFAFLRCSIVKFMHRFSAAIILKELLKYCPEPEDSSIEDRAAVQEAVSLL